MSTSVYGLVCTDHLSGDIDRAPLPDGGVRFTCKQGAGTLWFGVPGVDGWPADDDRPLDREVGYRVGIGDGRTAFVWLVQPSLMERWRYFLDDYGNIYDRAGLVHFIEACDEQHMPGCDCLRHGHPVVEGVFA